MTKEMMSPTHSPARLSLHVTPERRQLLQWAQEHTQARSQSEAVFLALAELRSLVKEKRLQALERIHDAWKDDPRVEQAFRELDEGWRQWRA